MSGDDAQKQGGPNNPPSDADLSARLRDLDTKLARHRAETDPAPIRRSEQPGGVSPLGQAMRLSSEFIAGVAVGGTLGWVLDYFAGTKPWGLMVLLMLGLAAGLYNVMRSSGFLGQPPRKNGQDGA